MKKLIIISGLVVLLLNALCGLVFSNYEVGNVVATSIVVFMNTILLYSLHIVTMKDAFKMSFSIIFIILGFLLFIFGLFAPRQFENNWFFLLCIITYAIEILFILTTNHISKQNM